jgi:cobalt-zinc-cadmium efflux system membrane fusion protein
MKMKRAKVFRIIFLMISLVFSCENHHKNDVKPAEKDTRITISKQDFKDWNMSVKQIEKQEFSETIDAIGVIEVPPENRFIASTLTGGYIKNVPPLVGSDVKKGDLLLRIENTEIIKLQQEYLETTEQLEYLQSEYERHQRMMDENVVSEKRFLEAESNYKRSLAAYRGLKKQLQLLRIPTDQVERGVISSYIDIFSPLTGSVTVVNAASGSFVAPHTELVEIVNNEHIHLELMVFEKDILKLKKGQPIRFKITESSDKEYEAEIFLIGKKINKNRTVQVHAHILNEHDTNFIVGMFAEAKIEIGKQFFYSVPNEAVLGLGSESKILILDEETESHYYFKEIGIDLLKPEGDNLAIVSASGELNNKQVLTKGVTMAVAQ